MRHALVAHVQALQAARHAMEDRPQETFFGASCLTPCQWAREWMASLVSEPHRRRELFIVNKVGTTNMGHMLSLVDIPIGRRHRGLATGVCVVS